MLKTSRLLFEQFSKTIFYNYFKKKIAKHALNFLEILKTPMKYKLKIDEVHKK